jgi:hypothetical protein
MHTIFLDQLLRLGAGRGRRARRVGDDQVDLAAGECVFAFALIHDERAFHVEPTRGQRARFHGE